MKGKPLTVEELRAISLGDWVWIVYADVEIYAKKCELCSTDKNDEKEIFNVPFTDANFEYSDYGKSWIAYKNKEQAEEDTDYKKRYFALHRAVIEVCNELNSKSQLDAFYRLTLGGKVQQFERLEEKYAATDN